ncbi:MAG TPA: (Fe-S)-binding protein [Thermodesulfobacteriota bacterium]|nr:(Fe-S)-binding protein [Thermodesulfobacteriota bacterium]
MKLDDPRIKKFIRDKSLFMCLECGKCSASCPRMLTGKEYSPRLLAHKLIAEPDSESFIENSVWECLTCGLCEERCPSGVQVSRFIMEMRTLLAGTKGLKGYRSHDGALHSWMRLMTSPDLEQNRLDWLGSELKVAQSGPRAFFTGCAPYFDVFFSGIKVNTLSIVKDSIRLLNFLDIVPVVLEKERCCGHDLLWTGDRENFEALCRLNYKEFQAAGVEEVIVSCPECYQVWSQFMPEVIPGMKLRVTLLSDLLRREISKGGVTFKPLKRRATYQDPCRLGRMAGSCETPRALMEMIPDLDFKEMKNSGRSAVCCGNNGFINCDAYSKRIQVERLQEAKATRSDLLITACPKCMIHLTCAMRDPYREGSLSMEIRDLASVLADQIEWSKGEEAIGKKA